MAKAPTLPAPFADIVTGYQGQPVQFARFTDVHGEAHFCVLMSVGYVLDFIGAELAEEPDEWDAGDFKAHYPAVFPE